MIGFPGKLGHATFNSIEDTKGTFIARPNISKLSSKLKPESERKYGLLYFDNALPASSLMSIDYISNINNVFVIVRTTYNTQSLHLVILQN